MLKIVYQLCSKEYLDLLDHVNGLNFTLAPIYKDKVQIQRDKDQTLKTDTHNKEHKVTKNIQQSNKSK